MINYTIMLERKQVRTNFAKMIESLLKAGYCSSKVEFSRNIRIWLNEFNVNKIEALDSLNWDMKSPDKKLIDWAIINLQEAYEDGVTRYKRSSMHREYNPFERMIPSIPMECPWVLRELLDGNNRTLIEILPNNNLFLRGYMNCVKNMIINGIDDKKTVKENKGD